MSDHNPNAGDKNNTPNPIADLEARLAEIEAGFLDPYAFSSRTLIQATFPHSARAGKEITLKNGAMTVTMYSPNGLPHGVYPRLIMCWLTREAIRRRDLPVEEARTIPLGGSLSQFMRDVGIKSASGGKNGTITALRKQLKSLFSTFISIKVEDHEYRDGKQVAFDQLDNTLIAESALLWWDPKQPEQLSMQNSSVTLTAAFYRELTCSAVPLDVNVLRQIRRSPLAIDIYCWLTYRLSYHRGFTVVTWEQLRQQFGAGYPDTVRGRSNWRLKVAGALERVLEVWPEASVTVTANGVMLKPGSPSVPVRVQEEIKKRYGLGENPF
ncbi:Plasmid encoded RepA protein (plasmid) [Corynebacterium occultum]|uniref:Plasmid encoded RepA protein n=1 Tax=Corynebacterium occultum TaxID=2675219 RepID=A0A6B8W859_9CORY|nr:replication protein RepA [Corynebacterium occultum]QGU08811.1 Plasmid encoded RepA protein [Corynebacterium occultum]